MFHVNEIVALTYDRVARIVGVFPAGPGSPDDSARYWVEILGIDTQPFMTIDESEIIGRLN